MLNKFKNHCKNPITWGAYYKLCGISMILSILMGGAMIVKERLEIKKFNRKFNKEFISEEEES